MKYRYKKVVNIPECETCGKSAELVSARIEESVLRVCRKCAKLGQALNIEAPICQKPRQEPKLSIIEISPGFSSEIHAARESRNMTRKQLAEKLGEKENVIERAEKGMRPTNRVAEKLEKFLGIRILGYEENWKPHARVKTEPMTVGDVVEIRVRKKA